MVRWDVEPTEGDRVLTRSAAHLEDAVAQARRVESGLAELAGGLRHAPEVVRSLQRLERDVVRAHVRRLDGSSRSAVGGVRQGLREYRAADEEMESTARRAHAEAPVFFVDPARFRGRGR